MKRWNHCPGRDIALEQVWGGTDFWRYLCRSLPLTSGLSFSTAFSLVLTSHTEGRGSDQELGCEFESLAPAMGLPLYFSEVGLQHNLMTVRLEWAQELSYASWHYILSPPPPPPDSASLLNTAPNLSFALLKNQDWMCYFGPQGPLTFDPKFPHSETICRWSEILREWGRTVLIPCDTEEGTVVWGSRKTSVQIQALPAVPIWEAPGLSESSSLTYMEGPSFLPASLRAQDYKVLHLLQHRGCFSVLPFLHFNNSLFIPHHLCFSL